MSEFINYWDEISVRCIDCREIEENNDVSETNKKEFVKNNIKKIREILNKIENEK